ncbi:DUF4328 domain-containing protein [Novosphingobium sp. MW5]|nr:DUF4328 domain-containing protein [Novosphingobium sp. MW5]
MNDMDEQLRGLGARAKFSYLLIWIFVAANGACLAAEAIYLTAPGARVSFGAMIDTLTVVGSVAYLASAVAIGMWIHRAHKNLYTAGYEGLEFTPGWSVGWFFVPFANLVMPFRAMKELIEVSCPDDTRQGVRAWWGCFTIGNIITNLSMQFMVEGDLSETAVGMDIVANAITIASAIFLYRIIGKVTTSQQSGVFVAQAFA